MKKIYTIKEYESFTTKENISGYTYLPDSTFKQLEDFILSNKYKNDEAMEIMGISSRKGIGKIITAKNYVGVVTMNDGTTIEILPKIKDTNDLEDKEIKKIFIRMLQTLKNSPFKTIQKTTINVHKMNIFEVFIRMFIDEIFMIVKKGLRNTYVLNEDNLNVFKGKMVFSKQISKNLGHKERFYTEYDEFSVNRAENRLIKSTIKYLYTKTNNHKNKTDLKTLMNVFDELDDSLDYVSDFARCNTSDRSMKDYRQAILWCKVFLEGKTFTSFSGSNVAFALLFPMEEVFESYVANRIKKLLDVSKYSISIQDKSYHLFDNPRKFRLQPDIVIIRKEDHKVFILDTKWKILGAEKHNYGISQSDMYQMYAYHKKYQDVDGVTLIYPKISNLENADISYLANDDVKVDVKFFDLME